jgi:O-antigen/teichoic acid export membrane protein
MSKAGEVYNVPRGTAYLTTQQIITYTTYLIFYVALARILRSDEVGQISLLLAAQTVFTALTQLGLPSAATRYVSGNIGKGDRQTAGAVARTILRLSVLVGAVGFAIAALISPIIGPSVIGSSNAGTLLILTFFSGFLLDIILVYGAYFIGVGAYARNLYQNALYIPFSRGLGLLLAYLGYRVTGIVSGWVIGGLAAVLLSSYLWHGQLPEKLTSHKTAPSV